jgi:hypothetical protein
MGAAVLKRALLVAVAVSVASLALMPAASVAHHTKAGLPRIYMASCLPVGPQWAISTVAPRAFRVGCVPDVALGPQRLEEAYDVTYRHYGTGLALGFGKVRVCLGPNSEVEEACTQHTGYPYPSYLSYPASFRFFDVVRCTSPVYSGPRLLYGKFSYTFAERPWEIRTNLMPSELARENEPLRCQPVKLPRR